MGSGWRLEEEEWFIKKTHSKAVFIYDTNNFALVGSHKGNDFNEPILIAGGVDVDYYPELLFCKTTNTKSL